MLVETETDVDGAAMVGGDQLWFGDEARYTADPVHLMRVFGLSDVTAM